MIVEGLGALTVSKALDLYKDNPCNSEGVEYGNIEAMLLDKYPNVLKSEGYVDFLEKCEKEIQTRKETEYLKENKLYPEVGMGITYHLVSDCYAGTIVKVSPSGRTFWYTRDRSEVDDTKDNDWYSGEMHYIFFPDPDGTPVKVVPLRNKTTGIIVGWKEPGRYGNRVTLGSKNQYQDPSF